MVPAIRLVISITILLGLAGGVASGNVPDSAAQTPAVQGGEFAHPEWFADSDWLSQHLNDDDLAIIALTPADDFTAGHIPGAAQIDWPDLEIVETDEASVETWQGEVEAMLSELGVDRADTVVVYDGGTFYAARLWWILYFLGHEDVRVLDGGLQAWTESGGETETGESTVTAASEPYRGEPNQDAVVTIDEAVDEYEEGEALFVDARSVEEFTEGHIPGAINIPFIANAVEGEAKYWKSPDELLELYESAGITPDMRVIPYCTTGVRSAVTYFTLSQLGYEDIALFTGSFEEWSSDPDRPVEPGA